MRLLILTLEPSDYNPQRIKEEAKKRNIEALVSCWGDLFFKIDKDLKIFVQGKNILDFDFFIFRPQRSYHKRIDFRSYLNFLTCFLIRHGKRLLNGESFTKFPENFDKLKQHLVFFEKEIPFIPTFSYSTKYILREERFPILIKPLIGAHGDNIALIKNKKELRKFMAKKEISNFLTQRYLTTGTDFRIIVVGNKVLGALQKFKAKGKIVTNIGAGGIGQKAELTKELASLAEKATKAVFCDFAGVDIMYDKQRNPYVLEVNRKAEFEAFEKYTGINVAGKIIDHLLNTL